MTSNVMRSSTTTRAPRAAFHEKRLANGPMSSDAMTPDGASTSHGGITMTMYRSVMEMSCTNASESSATVFVAVIESTPTVFPATEGSNRKTRSATKELVNTPMARPIAKTDPVLRSTFGCAEKKPSGPSAPPKSHSPSVSRVFGFIENGRPPSHNARSNACPVSGSVTTAMLVLAGLVGFWKMLSRRLPCLASVHAPRIAMPPPTSAWARAGWRCCAS
mmetsp:Transcript_4689/g.17700  ORF Transcript_4689/g.17700 Transcript_4689/m.17700 type:complete len:219 (-) Transcript_4689:521-1177(-)